MNALPSRETPTERVANDDGDDVQRRLEARFRYGLAAFGDRFTPLPEIAAGLSNAGRDYSLGWRLVRGGGAPGGGAFELSFEPWGRESANDDTPSAHAIGVGLTARFWRERQERKVGMIRLKTVRPASGVTGPGVPAADAAVEAVLPRFETFAMRSG